jgi:hypothetical protein
MFSIAPVIDRFDWASTSLSDSGTGEIQFSNSNLTCERSGPLPRRSRVPGSYTFSLLALMPRMPSHILPGGAPHA